MFDIIYGCTTHHYGIEFDWYHFKGSHVLIWLGLCWKEANCWINRLVIIVLCDKILHA